MFVAYLNSFSASRYNYNGHRESAYVMVNRSNTLPDTYLELVEYQDGSCRLLRHSKIFAPVHSLSTAMITPTWNDRCQGKGLDVACFLVKISSKSFVATDANHRIFYAVTSFLLLQGMLGVVKILLGLVV